MTKRPLDSHDLLPALGLESDYQLETLAIRAGHARSQEQEHAEPLFLTSSFVFRSAAEAAARFAGEEAGNVYSRFTNPTVALFETRLAALEGAERCVATASGMAAILVTCLSHLRHGDHVLCSRNVFGTTLVLFEKYLSRYGITVSFCDVCDPQQWREALREQTRMLFLETPSNPLNEVADLAAFVDLARQQGALLVVDNCFCTPALQTPLAQGADLVIHSATKYLDGQGRCVGGAVAGPARYMDEIATFMRSGGLTMSPFNAWVFLKGLETLKLRMFEHSKRALQLATWLQTQDWVEKVWYCGLPEHTGHELAKAQQKAFGAVLAFSVSGGREEAWRFIDQTRLISITANLGDVKSTITHPASTTHGRLSEDERERAGISENLIRLCVGLEDPEDLQRDLLAGSSGL